MPDRALVLSLLPHAFATRSRKAAAVLSADHDCTFVSLSKVGRNKSWDKPGNWVVDGVMIRQVAVRTPRTEPTRQNILLNVLQCYLPGLVRLVATTIREPAEVVFVNGTYLLPIAVIHRAKFKSRVILDINERPAMVTTKGSVAAVFRRFERRMLRLLARFVDTATVVTNADIEIVRSLGFTDVRLLRNVPLSNWKADWKEPPFLWTSSAERPALRAIAMGTMYEGRGYEILIEAVAIANATTPVDLVLCGPGRDTYRDRLRHLANEIGAPERVTFLERVEPSDVSSLYIDADVGLVLYESHDPGNDGLSNKLFECVCSGRPVIASNLPENVRFISENKVGWLVETTPAHVAEALIRAADQPQLAVLAKHCRQFGDDHLNWEREFALATHSIMPPQDQ